MPTIQLASPSLNIAAPKGAGTAVRAHSAAAKEAPEGAPADFTLSLTAFLDQLAPAAVVPATTPVRKDHAAAGKDLPVTAPDTDDDDDDDALPAVLAWLPPLTPATPMVKSLPRQPAILVTPPAAPAAPTTATIAAGTGRPQVIDGPQAEPILLTKGIKEAAPLPVSLPVAAATPDEAAPVALSPALAAPGNPERPSIPRISVPLGAAPALQQPPAIAAAQPAVQVFAAALARAAAPDREEPVRTSAVEQVVPTTAAPLVGTVTATADTRQAPLDMSQPHWPRHMIDHIEALRDSADANDTRIRLVPDALGTIDVSLKREGDAVRVHFTAEQHETRTLLADAAPKLAELAEQRGIRLTQGMTDSNVGTDLGGNARRAPDRPQPNTPSRPASADTSTDPTRDEDARVA